jgi:hypothetical protein
MRVRLDKTRQDKKTREGLISHETPRQDKPRQGQNRARQDKTPTKYFETKKIKE